jgi:hypothetical protein
VRKTHVIDLVCATLSALFAASANADTLKVRTDCGTEPLCFEALAPLLEELHVPSGGRSVPGPTNPVLVDIGPGVFDLTSTDYAYCDGLSHVTFRGAGKHATVLTGGGFPSQGGFLGEDAFSPWVVVLIDCTKVEFAALAIRTEGTGDPNGGVRFVGDGSSYWTDMIIYADDSEGSHPIPWLDSGASSAEDSEHYWYGVEIGAHGALASGLWITGSTHEIRASEIEIESAADGGASAVVYGAVFGSGAFDLTVQGSTLEIEDAGSDLGHLAVVYMSNASGFYPSCAAARVSIEGSRIVGTTSSSGGSVMGLRNACTGTFTGSVAARGNQFDLVGPTRRRLYTIGGAFDAPYSLGSGANPPNVGTLWSVKGMDTFVETDCSATRCNDTSQGGESHLLSYDTGCTTAGPWFDQTAQLCRGT